MDVCSSVVHVVGISGCSALLSNYLNSFWPCLGVVAQGVPQVGLQWGKPGAPGVTGEVSCLTHPD